MRDWRLRQEMRQAELERLRSAWKQGLDSGEPEPFDIETIKKAARERLAESGEGPGK